MSAGVIKLIRFVNSRRGMLRRTKSPLVLMMAWHLYGARPLAEPTLTLKNKFQWTLHQITKCLSQENTLKIRTQNIDQFGHVRKRGRVTYNCLITQERYVVSDHQRIDCLLKKWSNCISLAIYEGNLPVTGEFPPLKSSNTERVFMTRRQTCNISHT